MTHRFLTSLGALTSVVAMAMLTPVSVAGQTRAADAKTKKPATTSTWTPPLTPDGQPELQGVWLNNSATPFERPKALEGREFLTDEEVAELKKRAARIFDVNGKSDYASGDAVFNAAWANLEVYKNPNSVLGAIGMGMIEREFDNRTSLIVSPTDGKIPALTPGARRKLDQARASGQRQPAGPEDLSNLLRCITFGVPRLGGIHDVGIYGYYEIVQAPGYVVLTMEAIHDARIIPLDGRPHLPQTIRQWNGDSRGRWEGKTLVVETANFSAQSNFRGSAENLRLVERFTRVAHDTINYEILVDDSTTWTKPWSAEIRLRQTQDRIYEYGCHEGSYDPMRTLLALARAEEKAIEEAANGPK